MDSTVSHVVQLDPTVSHVVQLDKKDPKFSNCSCVINYTRPDFTFSESCISYRMKVISSSLNTILKIWYLIEVFHRTWPELKKNAK